MPSASSAKVDDNDTSVHVVLRWRLGPAASFERKLQPRLLSLVLTLFLFPLTNLLDDERR
jgi:hypothetical protein